MGDEFDDFSGGGFGDDLSGAPPDVASGGIDTGSLMGFAGSLTSMGSANLGLMPAAGRVVGTISTRLGNIRMSKVWAAVKRFGPEFTAAGLGWSVSDLMTMILHSGALTSRRRRRRGISSRDVRTTRRVVRFVNRISHDLGCVHRPHFARRRAA